MIEGNQSRREFLAVVAMMEKRVKRAVGHWHRSLPVTEAQWVRVRRRRYAIAGCIFLASFIYTFSHPSLIALTVWVFIVPEFLPWKTASYFVSLGYQSQAIARAAANMPRRERRAYMKRLRVLGARHAEVIESKDTSWILEKAFPELSRDYAALAEEVHAVGEEGPGFESTEDLPQVIRGGDGWIRIEYGGRSVGFYHAESIGWMTATACCGHAISQSIFGLACSCGKPHFGLDGSEEDELLTDRMKNYASTLKAPKVTDEDALALAARYLPMGPVEQLLLLGPLEEIHEAILEDREKNDG